MEFSFTSWDKKHYSVLFLSIYGKMDVSQISKILRETTKEISKLKSNRVKFCIDGDQRLYNFTKYIERKSGKKIIIF